MMRAKTLKASPARVGALLAYYAGLAEDQARRDGLARGPIDSTSTRRNRRVGGGGTVAARSA